MVTRAQFIVRAKRKLLAAPEPGEALPPELLTRAHLP